jgi:hypothetical protein
MTKLNMTKLKKYFLTALWIAKSEDKNLLIVVYKLIVARACYGLTIKIFNHYGLIHKDPSDYGDYMRVDELLDILWQVNSKQGHLTADSKLLFHEKCVQHQLPTPAIMGCLSADRHSGEIHGVPYIQDEAHFMSLLSTYSSDSFIFKPDFGSHGRGLLRFHLADQMLCDDDGRLLEPGQLLGELSTGDETYLLQPALKPHESVRPIMPGNALGSARIITLNRNGEVSVEFAIIKIPTGNNVADNFADGRMGNLVASIDIASGIIGRCFGPSKALGPSETYVDLLESCVRHPDSGVLITGFEFPQWQEMICTVERAALKLDFLFTVGWDIALCEGGPTLLEANARYSVNLMQVAYRKGLKREMTSLLIPTI